MNKARAEFEQWCEDNAPDKLRERYYGMLARDEIDVSAYHALCSLVKDTYEKEKAVQWALAALKGAE